MNYKIFTEIKIEASKLKPYKVTWNVQTDVEEFGKRLINIFPKKQDRSQKLLINVRPKFLIKLGFKPIKLNIDIASINDVAKNYLEDSCSFKDEGTAKAFELEYKRYIGSIVQEEFEKVYHMWSSEAKNKSFP